MTMTMTMHTTYKTWAAALLALATTVACSDDGLAGLFDGDDGGEANEETGGEDTGNGTDGDGDGDGEPSGDGDGDGDGGDFCPLDCGPGECVTVEGEIFCECPEGTAWAADGCEPCPLVDPSGHELIVPVVGFDGEFRVNGVAPPKSEYDDANLWLENSSTQDRVALGNSHDGEFAVRVTPGLYDIVYEVETPGPLMPHNPRVVLGKVALFESTTRPIDIPVVALGGQVLLDGVSPPASEYDDANIYFRDHLNHTEVHAGNTHDGSWALNLVPGSYDIIYRVETPGELTPRNDGAVLRSLDITGSLEVLNVEISSAPLTGAYLINTVPAPVSEYNDANIFLESDEGGTVALGNTHDQTFAMRVIPGDYALIYAHETGAEVPQNQRGRFDEVSVPVDGTTKDVDIPMVDLSGALTINTAPAPASEYDDGIVTLIGLDSSDTLLLANTHDQGYAVKLLPGSYRVHYASETSGGTVPQNTSVVLDELVVDSDATNVDIDIPAVSLSGSFTVAGGAPPDSVYEDGRIYLRSISSPDADAGASPDAVLLGNTRDGGYTAIVVPGEYEAFYTQETGGEVVPSNQNASLGLVTVAGGMTLDLDVPVVALSGEFALSDGPVPMSAIDGGQLYLRALAGDSVLLGDSFANSFAVKLVAGTYGVYYRSEASVTMPENDNGRFACITVE
jgi:hypothetical protein